jgi:hypothetical protein
MTFELALQYLKQGYKVYRRNWNLWDTPPINKEDNEWDYLPKADLFASDWEVFPE